jgi:hypothetical protein
VDDADFVQEGNALEDLLESISRISFGRDLHEKVESVQNSFSRLLETLIKINLSASVKIIGNMAVFCG